MSAYVPRPAVGKNIFSRYFNLLSEAVHVITHPVQSTEYEISELQHMKDVLNVRNLNRAIAYDASDNYWTRAYWSKSCPYIRGIDRRLSEEMPKLWPEIDNSELRDVASTVLREVVAGQRRPVEIIQNSQKAKIHRLYQHIFNIDINREVGFVVPTPYCPVFKEVELYPDKFTFADFDNPLASLKIGLDSDTAAQVLGIPDLHPFETPKKTQIIGNYKVFLIQD